MIIKSKLKTIILLCLVAFCSVLLMTGCGETREGKRSLYAIILSYDEQEQTLYAKQSVTYVNDSENAFDRIYFHLYANAFRSGRERTVVSLNKMAQAYYDGQSEGGISISSIQIEGKDVDFAVEGEIENILSVPLPQLVYPDEEIKIYMEYSVKLAKINHRLGVGQSTINFGNFYPILCVYEDGVGFFKNEYHSNGDPFYSQCADYEVEIDFDQQFTLASSGNKVSAANENGRSYAQIKGDNIRDFAFILSKKHNVISCENEGTTISYYGYEGDDDFEENLVVAKEAVIFFNEKFGPYPYKQLSVVKASFLNGGMEYPNMVLISDDVGKEDFKYVIVHEIAHQWWYGVVGNDQYNHAWMDESLAEYSTLLFFKNHPQYEENFNDMILNAEKSYKTFVKVYTKVNGSVDGVMDKPLCEFDTEPEYVQCTYTKGVLLLDGIRKTIGDKKFEKALKNYYKNFSYKEASPADFIATFIKAGGGDLEGYINSFLQDKIVFGE